MDSIPPGSQLHQVVQLALAKLAQAGERRRRGISFMAVLWKKTHVLASSSG